MENYDKALKELKEALEKVTESQQQVTDCMRKLAVKLEVPHYVACRKCGEKVLDKYWEVPIGEETICGRCAS